MISMEEALKSIPDRDFLISEYYGSDIMDFVYTYDEKAKEAYDLYLKWGKDHTFPTLYFEEKHEGWINHKENMEDILIRLYYRLGEIFFIKELPIDRLGLFHLDDIIKKHPYLSKLDREMSFLESGIVADSGVNTQTFTGYKKNIQMLREATLPAVARLSYYYCFLEKQELDKLIALLMD